MTTKKDVRSARNDAAISDIESKSSLRSTKRGDRGQRKLNNTEDIKARKAAKIPNIKARRDNRNMRVKEGRGQRTARFVGQSINKAIKDFQSNTRDVLLSVTPDKLRAARGMPDTAGITSALR